MLGGASRAPARGLLAEWPREWPREWPTWLALAGCYLERQRYLAENGGYLIRGYTEVVRRWLVTPREPVVHPSSRRDGAE